MSKAKRAPRAALLAAAVSAPLLAGCSDEPRAAAGAPNVIVVMTDDQAMNSFTAEAMPNTFRLVAEGGTLFTDAYAMPPLCCPARATFLTGQYPHNHGVVQNYYKQLREKKSTLASWLDQAGYNVGLTGKFLNEYHPARPAPGFDHWWELRSNPGYYGYDTLDGDQIETAGTGREDYSTLAVTREAVEFIDEAAGAEEPFFLWASYYAPHVYNKPDEPVCKAHSAQVLPEDWELFAEAPVPRPAAFNEADITDKPPPSAGFAPLTQEQVAQVTEAARCAMAAVHRVDVGIAEILSRLEDAGIDDETAIFFISDNGYFFGEHRRPGEKAVPYEGDLEVPMAARVPPGVLGAKPVERVGEPTGTLDLAPTILELTGAKPCLADECRTLDGRSLVGLLRGEKGSWPHNRVRLSEVGKDCGNYASVRRGDWMYTEWYDQGVPPDCGVIGTELYDLGRDPHQLDNLLGIQATRDRPGVLARQGRMSALLSRMQTCQGIAGRDETENPC
ncbi:MAG: sulfatase family protein [Solirubrobacterales bacterium]